MAFSPDGKRLATAGGLTPEKSLVRVWDYPSGARAAELEVPSGTVRCVRFSPDGQALAVAAGEKSVRIWSFAERP